VYFDLSSCILEMGADPRLWRNLWSWFILNLRPTTKANQPMGILKQLCPNKLAAHELEKLMLVSMKSLSSGHFDILLCIILFITQWTVDHYIGQDKERSLCIIGTEMNFKTVSVFPIASICHSRDTLTLTCCHS
jgi:hypothetical protein